MSEFRLGEFNSDFPFSIKQISTQSFLPSDISGLSWWLDAADSSTITLSGSDVSQWDDKSGLSKDMVQGTALNQPTYSTSVLNGKNVVSFSNPNFMTSSGAIDFDTNVNDTTIFIVALSDSSISANNTIIGTASSAGNTGTLINMQDALVRTRYLHRQGPGMAGGDNLLTTLGSIPDNTPVLLSYLRAAGLNQEAFLDGSSIGSIVPSASAHTADITVGIGRLTPFVSDRYLAGYIAEIVMYTRALNSTEQSEVESYLRNKWGL